MGVPDIAAQIPGQLSGNSAEVESDMSEILGPSHSHAEQALVQEHQQTVSDAQAGHTASAEPYQLPAEDISGLEEDGANGMTEQPMTPTSEHAGNQLSTSSQQQAEAEAPAGAEADAEAAPFAQATFVVPTENWKHLQSVPLATTAAEIKHSLCSNWSIAESALSVKYNKKELKNHESLASCGIQVCASSCCAWHVCKQAFQD